MDLPVLTPAIYLVAGIVFLIFPRILNFAIAGYLIFVGATGLWPNILG